MDDLQRAIEVERLLKLRHQAHELVLKFNEVNERLGRVTDLNSDMLLFDELVSQRDDGTLTVSVEDAFRQLLLRGYSYPVDISDEDVDNACGALIDELTELGIYEEVDE